MPVVLIDHPRDGLDLCAVTVDHLLGGRLVGEHLLALGHRRVAYRAARSTRTGATGAAKGCGGRWPRPGSTRTRPCWTSGCRCSRRR